MIQINKSNESNSLFSSPKNFLRRGSITPFGQMMKFVQKSPQRKDGSPIEKIEEVDFSYRKS